MNPKKIAVLLLAPSVPVVAFLGARALAAPTATSTGIEHTAAVAGSPTPVPQPVTTVWATSDFPTNSFGLTYGSDSAVTDERDAPDLIAADAGTASGEQGFLKKTDLLEHDGDPSNFHSPAEALRWQEKAAKAGPIELPLYDITGQKKIGTFTLTPATGRTVNELPVTK